MELPARELTSVEKRATNVNVDEQSLRSRAPVFNVLLPCGVEWGALREFSHLALSKRRNS